MERSAEFSASTSMICRSLPGRVIAGTVSGGCAPEHALTPTTTSGVIRGHPGRRSLGTVRHALCLDTTNTAAPMLRPGTQGAASRRRVRMMAQD
jgi:hypothetical protein